LTLRVNQSLANTTAIVDCRSARPPRLIQIDAPFSSRLSRDRPGPPRPRRGRKPQEPETTTFPAAVRSLWWPSGARADGAQGPTPREGRPPRRRRPTLGAGPILLQDCRADGDLQPRADCGPSAACQGRQRVWAFRGDQGCQLLYQGRGVPAGHLDGHSGAFFNRRRRARQPRHVA
jgi:hypothetical protein